MNTNIVYCCIKHKLLPGVQYRQNRYRTAVRIYYIINIINYMFQLVKKKKIVYLENVVEPKPRCIVSRLLIQISKSLLISTNRAYLRNNDDILSANTV